MNVVLEALSRTASGLHLNFEETDARLVRVVCGAAVCCVGYTDTQWQRQKS